MFTKINHVDSFIVFLYFFVTLVIGLYYGKKVKNIQDFAISDRNYGTAIMVATLFATVIGGGSTFGVSTKAFNAGIIFVIAFYGAVINKIIVAYFIAPKIAFFQDCTSIGDSMHKIYGRFGRLISGLSIICVSIGSIGSQVAAVGFVCQYLIGIPFYVGVTIGFGVLIVYASFGGARSVIATDVFQFILIVVFIPIIFLVGLNKTGGIMNLIHLMPHEKLTLFVSPENIKKALTMFFVMSFSALDPSFIQRLIISRNVKQAVKITRITAYLSIPLFMMMGLIGLIAFCLNNNLNPNHALAYVVDTTLPIGLKGLAISALLATLMSTADSDLHVLGLSVLQDLILPFSKKNYSERTKLFFLRTATFLAGLLSLAVAIYFKNIIDIMIFAFSFWGPTVLVPFIFALYGVIFKKRDFFIGTMIGFFIVVFWNLLLEKFTGLDGFIPAMIGNSSYFFIKKRQNRHVLEDMKRG